MDNNKRTFNKFFFIYNVVSLFTVSLFIRATRPPSQSLVCTSQLLLSAVIVFFGCLLVALLDSTCGDGKNF